MMGQQRTTYDIERVILKGQAQGVAGNRSCATWQMRPQAVQKGHLQPNAGFCEHPLGRQSHVSGPRAHFQ
jgi:hypothetical protein